MNELRRFGTLRRGALVLSLVALAGVLVLGILPGLLVAAALSLVYVIRRLSRPRVDVLARQPATGAWGSRERHPDWETPAGILVLRPGGPLFYPNALAVKDSVLTLARTEPAARVVVLDLAASTDFGVETLDMLAELTDVLAAEDRELRLAEVHATVLELLRRRGLVPRVRTEATIDAAVR